MKFKWSFIFLILFTTSVFSQTQPVKIKSLQGTYKGKLKKNMAHGKGVAFGVDKYEGSFKSGYPHGKGIYTFKDTAVFEGNFKKGLKTGKGQLRFLNCKSQDSIVDGYWKNDKYIGVNKDGKPYKIISLSNISRIDFKKNNLPGNEVHLKMMRNQSFAYINSVEIETSQGSEEYIDDYTKKISIREYPCIIRIMYNAVDKDGSLSVRYEASLSIDEPCNIEAVLNY